MKTEQEVLDALNTLRCVCLENNAHCEKCILRNGYGTCGVIYDSNGESYYKVEDWNLVDFKVPRLILN